MPGEVRHVGSCGVLAAVAERVGTEWPESGGVLSAAGAQGREPGVVEAPLAGQPWQTTWRLPARDAERRARGLRGAGVAVPSRARRVGLRVGAAERRRSEERRV